MIPGPIRSFQRFDEAWQRDLFALSNAENLMIKPSAIEWPKEGNPLKPLIGNGLSVALTFTVVHHNKEGERARSIFLMPVLRFQSTFPEGRYEFFIPSSQCFIPAEHYQATLPAEEVLSGIGHVWSERYMLQSLGFLLGRLHVHYIKQAVEFVRNTYELKIDVVGLGSKDPFLRLQYLNARELPSPYFFFGEDFMEKARRELQSWKARQKRAA